MSIPQPISLSGIKRTQLQFLRHQPPAVTNLYSQIDPFNWLAGQAVEGKQNTVSLLHMQQAQPHEQTQRTGRRSRAVDHKNYQAQVKPPTTISDRAATARSAARANTRAASAAPDRTSRVDTAKGWQKPHRYLKSVLYSR
jgi:hypothetical protein